MAVVPGYGCPGGSELRQGSGSQLRRRRIEAGNARKHSYTVGTELGSECTVRIGSRMAPGVGAREGAEWVE